tara:strand:+ start:3321 stop:3812 length:492 start_codon:yes stop_codon:yes gene_type:complete
MTNPVGRPVKWKTSAEMQVAIDNYFESVKLRKKHQDSDDLTLALLTEKEQAIYDIQEYSKPTVTGLAIALDLTRKGLLDYEIKGEFCDTVKKAKARVEEYIEQHMYGQSVAGGIFNLKNNFGWVDKTEVDSKVTPGGVWEMVEVPSKHKEVKPDNKKWEVDEK